MRGILYLVSTPIGNLEDITLRALETLKSVDLIAAEDTRHTRGLLTRFDIHTPMTSYHAFNEHGVTEKLLDRVESEGLKLAMVSDAGTPAIADPGFLLVREAVARGIEPVVIPGVSALTFAVTKCGLPVDRFEFRGFVPVKSGRKTRFLTEAVQAGVTVFCYESPFRIGKTLSELARIAPDAPIAVIREATKIHEEVRRGRAAEVAAALGSGPGRGEYVLAVGPTGGAENAPEESDDGDDADRL